MKCEVQLRSPNTSRIYPINECAKLFAGLAGRKTLMRQDLEYIRELGFEIVWVPLTPDGDANG